MLPAPATEGLDGVRLRAVADLWRREKREVDVAFGGVSMLPTIAPGQRLRLRCDTGSLQVGDVIAFLRHDRLFVHRIVAIVRGGEWLLTRGDAHPVPDPPLRRDSVIGRILAEPVSPHPRPTRAAAAIARSIALLLSCSPFLASIATLLLKHLWVSSAAAKRLLAKR
ncbi:MAG TPA: S26 family signal peptidase [Thermoanaerobaculia bacterium]|nr:S26 family signal peptidase [Thermoanaerobaculia bacterium]